MGKKSKRNKRQRRRAAKLKLRQQRIEKEALKEKDVTGCGKTVFVPGVGTVPTVGAGGVPVTTIKDDDWEVELDIVKECGKVCDNGGAIVWIEPLAKVKIDALMKEYKSMEWLAYLLGDKENMTVKDIFVPEQSASAALVDDVECVEFNNLSVIGVMHSHHGMGTGFSGTDHKYVNQNHDISLVVAHSGIAGQIRSKVPCGALMITEAKVKLSFSVDGFEPDKFISKVKSNIKKKTYHYNQPVSPPYQQDWQKQDKSGVGSGYWYNGKWHRSKPIEDKDKEIEENLKEIEEIHKSKTGTAAHYWNCPHCDQQNYTLNTRICWSCKKHKTPQVGAWMCNYCKGVNNRMDSTTCIFCKTVRPTPTPDEVSLEEENQKKIEEECNKDVGGNGKTEVDTSGWKSSIPEKHLGMYACGRCGGKWEDVDMRKFTECPNCDRLDSEKTLEDELKTDLDTADKEIEQAVEDLAEHMGIPLDEKEQAKEEKKRLNTSATDATQHTQIITPGPLVAGTDTPLDEDVHICRICKLVVLNPNTVHRACLATEQGEGNYPCKFCGLEIGVPNAYHVECFEKKQAGVKPEDDIWESETKEPVV